jgi:hypothetical protein
MSVTISISTGPSLGEEVPPEIRLLKPALLYADRVRLNSPAVAAIKAVMNRAPTATPHSRR